MDRRWSYYHRRWTPRSPQDHAKITPRPRQDHPKTTPRPPRTSATLHGRHCFCKQRAPRCMGALLAGPRRHQTTPRPRQDRPLKKYRFFIKNVGFSLEKCRFGAHRGVLHYVLKRKMVNLRKHVNFELEICVKARGGRAARCMGSVVVAEIVASEARQPLARGHVRPRQERVRRPLSMPFPGRSIERVLRDLTTPSK